MKNILSFMVLILSVVFLTVSCFQDLDTVPIDKDILTSENYYRTEGAYKQVLAKIYAGLATTGQQGPAGQGDLGGIDEGFSSYLRQYWYQQELTTDEAVVGWADETIKDFHEQDWTVTDVFINAFYNRVFYQIGVCNEFLRQTKPAALDRRDTDDALRKEIETYQYEARFMRALSYWHAMDQFRNVPFVTEDDGVGSFHPIQIKSEDLFTFIEEELLAIESKIAPVRTNEYARADQGAVWMLLAKLYLNAEQYGMNAKYEECLEYCEKLIDAGYTLENEFQHLFLADNHLSNEVIFPIAFDGLNTKTYGGTTFIIKAGIGGDINALESGVNEGWGGTRTTKQIVNLFRGEVGGKIYAFGTRKNLPQIYLPGDYQGNEINKDFSLTKVDGADIHEGHQYFSEANTTFMIAPYPDLGFLYGDNNGDGTLDIAGSPLQIGEAGFYFISVNLKNKTYILEKRDYYIAGSAVTEETDFEWDEKTELLKAVLDVVPGEVYFGVKGNESITFGDNEIDGILDYGGSSLNIVEGGPIQVFLNLRKRGYLYEIGSLSFDRRSIFGTKGQSLEIDDIADFQNGYAVLKFKNIDRDGIEGSNNEYPDTDFPMFRLGDVYLMAAEALLRVGGDKEKATEYFNEVRSRAYQSSLANINSADLDYDAIMDERARELMWEAHRRTDLIRFGKFSESDYLWAWKGGVKEGRSVEAYRDVFPIPEKDLNNNINLEQNTGY